MATNWNNYKNNNSSYTSLDTVAVRDQLIDYLQNTQDKLTDFNESSTIAILIELMSGIGDMLAFRLDKQALETYLPTAKQRKNVKALLSLIGYQLDMTVSAKSTARFTLKSDYPYDSRIVIPKYTQLSGSDDSGTVYYATLEDAELPIGEFEVDVPIIQGVVKEVTYKVSEIMDSNKLYINGTNIAQSSVIIDVDGTKWTEVPDVTVVPDNKTTFSVHEDKLDRAYILFHRNYSDMLPSDTSTKVTINYLESLGTDGEIREGFISRVVTDGITNISSGNRMYDVLSVTNIERSSGSSGRETVDHARIQAPKELTTVDRAITLDDYNNLLNGLPGVVKGIALDWKIDDMYYVNVPYKVDLYVVPETGDTASSTQLKEIEEFFSTRKMSSLQVTAKSANLVDVDVKATVHVVTSTSDYDRVKSVVIDKVTEYFKPVNQDFNTGVRMSNIITLIETSDDTIDYVDLASPSNMNLKKNEFPRLRNLDIQITGK